MRILREAYTKDELKQHVSDTRNIISALQDSLAILQSSFSDPDDSLDKEECSKLARYARGYEIDIDDMMKDFYDDFEKFIIDEPEEDEVEDDYEYEEDTEIEESINEDTVKTSDGKWTNKGDTGETHGKFNTKKEADAQRKAIFANGFKG